MVINGASVLPYHMILSTSSLQISSFKTNICPLAKVMRKELRKRNIDSLKVIYSEEEPIKIEEYSNSSCKTNCICPPGTKRKCTIRNQVPGSISFVPSVAGLIIAGEVIKDIIDVIDSEVILNNEFHGIMPSVIITKIKAKTTINGHVRNSL